MDSQVEVSPPLELPSEVWSHIISFLERPKPKLRTEEWSKLHQQDLATMMRVSKMHLEVTAPILYREPVVENVWSFLQSSDLGEDLSLSLPPYSHGKQDDPSEKPPITTSKALCYKHVQRLHLILTESSYSFSYFHIFFTYDEQYPYNCWQDIILENPSTLALKDYEGSYIASARLDLYSSLMRGLFLLVQRTGSHRYLRPHSLTFGAFGDRSWNGRQVEMEFKTEVKASFEKLKPAERQRAMAAMESYEGFVEAVGCSNRQVWGDFKPQNHCTRFYGGPMGMVNQPIFNWQEPIPVNDTRHLPSDRKRSQRIVEPTATTIHMDREMTFWGITLGGANNVIVHPFGTTRVVMEFGYMKHTLQYLLDSANRWRGEYGTLAENDVLMRSTTIDIYAHFLSSNQRKLRESQDDMDNMLGEWKGRIKLHPYSEAPSCPSCGWCLADDE